jgi:hypothetical protein
MGYVCVDFMMYRDGSDLKLMGYDIRMNAFPSLVFSCYLTLCAGFNQMTGKMSVLRQAMEVHQNSTRYAFVQNSIGHPGFSRISVKDVRKICYGEGMFFDLLHRTGFRMVFFDIPGKNQNFALTASENVESTLMNAERNHGFLLRLLGQKSGITGISSLANSLIAMRQFRERVFLSKGLVEVPLPAT